MKLLVGYDDTMRRAQRRTRRTEECKLFRGTNGRVVWERTIPWESSLRMWLRRVVFPLPRKPVRIVTGTLFLVVMFREMLVDGAVG